MPSPTVFITAYDPLNSIIRYYGRGCHGTLQGKIDPTGADVFADDSTLHADGPDAVAAMAVLIQPAVAYLEWAGMDIHLKKCGVTAKDMKTGQRVAIDSITLPSQLSSPISHTSTWACAWQLMVTSLMKNIMYAQK